MTILQRQKTVYAVTCSWYCMAGSMVRVQSIMAHLRRLRLICQTFKSRSVILDCKDSGLTWFQCNTVVFWGILISLCTRIQKSWPSQSRARQQTLGDTISHVAQDAWETLLAMYTFGSVFDSVFLRSVSFTLCESLWDWVKTHFLVLLSVYHMKETGWVKISQNDIGDLYYKYKEETQ